MAEPTERLWRVFPWDASAKMGEAFSVASVAPRYLQGNGRFDLPALTSVLYLATNSAHGYAEILRPSAPQTLTPHHLIHASGNPYASTWVDVPTKLFNALPNLVKGKTLDQYGIDANTLALPAHRRAQTQAVARVLWDAGVPGFRWWSAPHGEWLSTILFVARAPLARLIFGTPRVGRIDHPDVLEGASVVNMRV